MLDYCPKEGKQNSHRARAARNKTHAPTTGLHAPMSATTRAYTPIFNRFVPPVPVARLEPARPTGQPLLRRSCLPIPPHWQEKRGSENKHEQQPRDHSAPNQRDTRTPAAPPASPTRVRGHSQPAHPDRPNLLTNTEPRAPWRKHPSATRTHPAHHQCRHTPLRDSASSREHPRAVSAPRSA